MFFRKNKNEEALETIIQKLSVVEGRIGAIDARFRELEQKASHMDGVLDSSETMLKDAENRIVSIISDGTGKMLANQENTDISLGDILEELENQGKKNDHTENLISSLNEDNSGLLSAIINMIEMIYYGFGDKSVSEPGEELTEDLIKGAGEEPTDDHINGSTEIPEEKSNQWNNTILNKFVSLAEHAGIRTMIQKGVDVDYDRHQVAAVLSTDDENLNGRVAVVHAPGFEYKGKLIKKAVVSVYIKEECNH